MGAEIAGYGHYAPERIVPSAEIEERLGLPPDWIVARTGIRERRWAAPDEALTDIAVRAGEMALGDGGIGRDEVALTILATSTPDHLLPPSSPLVAHRLGLTRSGAIDMAGACAGFLYALAFADAHVRQHRRTVLVIAANILSRRINFADRGSAILFADAAGAVVVRPNARRDAGIIGLELGSDGSAYDLIKIPAGGSRTPFTASIAADETLMVIRDGKAVFTKAVDMMATTARAAAASAGIAPGDVGHWVPHQANTRIIEATRRQLGISPQRVVSTVARFGNSSAASIPFSWSYERAAGRMPAGGGLVLLSAAGAGLTGGSILWSG